jgi:glycosyltransferase involved in cell wall biosynthesis
MPKISVILPVYNGQDYLAEAIESVLSQSFRDFELIIINDGSTDSSPEIIGKFDDPRIRFFQQSNQGLAATLNRAISLARGEYIARQDQDDVCLPSRFEKQINFLEANPDVGMVGTSAEIWVGNERTSRLLKHPTDDASIKFSLLFDNHFIHSSVMIRRSVFEKVDGYAVDFSRQPPEDYELWSRIMKKYKLANLPDVLMAYREVEGSMSRTGLNPFLPNLIKISAENIAWTSGFSLDSAEVIAISRLSHGVFDQIPQGTNFSKMKSVLCLAAVKIANDSEITPSDLESILQRRINKLHYQYFNYRCGGLIGKMVNSRIGSYIKKIVQ